MLPVSTGNNAQQPVVLTSLLEPVLAVGLDELGQRAGLEGTGGFRPLVFSWWLALDQGLVRSLSGGSEVKPGGAGSLILVLLG